MLEITNCGNSRVVKLLGILQNMSSMFMGGGQSRRQPTGYCSLVATGWTRLLQRSLLW